MSSDSLKFLVLVSAIAVLAVAPAGAKVLVSVEEALASAFPDCDVARETVFLTEEELSAATGLAGDAVERSLTVRYVAQCGGSSGGTGYFDVHRVRTLDETLFVVVSPDGSVRRVEVVSFNEPLDYLPREGWYRQFDGRPLDDDLELDRSIRSVSGATLTAVATTAATRRVLAVHRVLEEEDYPAVTRGEATALHAANLLVGGTGLVYAAMRYVLEPVDEWAVINHPWQPHVQHLHVLLAPLLVFVCGVVWRGHVAGKLRNGNGDGNGNGNGRKPGGRSGAGLLFALVPMVASGYLIQTTTSETWRQIWIVLHLVSSGTWILVFFGHLRGQIAGRMRSRREDG